MFACRLGGQKLSGKALAFSSKACASIRPAFTIYTRRQTRFLALPRKRFHSTWCTDKPRPDDLSTSKKVGSTSESNGTSRSNGPESRTNSGTEDLSDVTGQTGADSDDYDYSKSTAEVYASDCLTFLPKYAAARGKLGYKYHTNPVLQRQALQDEIIEKMLNKGVVSARPWVIFTAGAMGAGKSWCMRQLSKKGYFNNTCFVFIDPDQIRRQLPEYAGYVQTCDLTAGVRTQAECGLISQVALEEALEAQKNVLVDGSLRDHEWYKQYFADIRRRHPKRRIAILHVIADRETVYKRAEKRAQQTGRVIPLSRLDEAIAQVPKSVNKLRPLVDYCATIDNNGGSIKLVDGNASWADFQAQWGVCADECENPEEGSGCVIRL
mmetsp:Transcript_11176/g.13220  ORF Transcript_11176/g.13220 Transcript_11176/m.13220 type:complete len:380 (+) Transcript_11176:62-1201(+)